MNCSNWGLLDIKYSLRKAAGISKSFKTDLSSCFLQGCNKGAEITSETNNTKKISTLSISVVSKSIRALRQTSKQSTKTFGRITVDSFTGKEQRKLPQETQNFSNDLKPSKKHLI